MGRVGRVRPSLETLAAQWTTPQAHDARPGSPERVGRPGPHGAPANLADDVTLWQTPAVDSFRSRGGDRKDEMGLDQQARLLWQTPQARDWKDGSSTDFPETLTGTPPLGRQVVQSGISGPRSSPAGPSSRRLCKTPHGIGNKGKTGNVGGASEFQKQVRLVTGKKRLNVLFVEWLQGLPIGFTDLGHSETASSPPAPPTPS